MSTEWYIIQFISDLRRRESKNIGIVTHNEDNWGLRMIGLDKSGKVDGKAIRGFQNLTTDGYERWVQFLRDAIKDDQWDIATSLHTQRPSNFVIMSGGKLFDDTPLSSLTNELFDDLVAKPKTISRDRERELDKVVQQIFLEAEVPVQRNVSIEGSWKTLKEEESINDTVQFEYRAGASGTTYFDKFPFSSHMTSTTELKSRDFYSRAEAAYRRNSNLKFGAFYSSSLTEDLSDKDLSTLLRPIKAVAKVVNVDDTQEAVRATRQLAGV